MHTICSSCLSVRLAQTMPRIYKPRIVDINTKTATLSVTLSKFAKTNSKSIGFGATSRSLPNDVRWVQRQNTSSLLVPEAT